MRNQAKKVASYAESDNEEDDEVIPSTARRGSRLHHSKRRKLSADSETDEDEYKEAPVVEDDEITEGISLSA